MNYQTATLLGRPDLVSNYGGAVQATTAGSPTASFSLPSFSAQAGVQAGSGQASLGILGVLVVGLLAFTLWTRRHQL